MKEYIFKQYLDNILKHMDISIEDFFEKSKKEYFCNSQTDTLLYVL